MSRLSGRLLTIRPSTLKLFKVNVSCKCSKKLLICNIESIKQKGTSGFDISSMVFITGFYNAVLNLFLNANLRRGSQLLYQLQFLSSRCRHGQLVFF